MKSCGSKPGLLLSARIVLGAIIVVAATGGFTLGYFVGKSASSPSVSAPAKQSINEPAYPQAALTTPKNEVSSPTHPVSPDSSVQGKSPEAAPASELKASPFAPLPVKENRNIAEQQSSAQVADKDVTTESADPLKDKDVYTVQAGAFRSRRDAEALRHRLEAKGYKTYIKREAASKGVIFYKVRIGEFERKKEAEMLALKLRKTNGLNTFVALKR